CSWDQRMSVPCLAERRGWWRGSVAGTSESRQLTGATAKPLPHSMASAPDCRFSAVPVAERSAIAMAPAAALPRRREVGPSSARSLLLTVLGEFVLPTGEPVWTGTLVTALGLFGIAEKAAR